MDLKPKSTTQKAIILSGVLLVFCSTLMPPWRYEWHSSYGLLFAPPEGFATIDLTRLFVEWFLIAVFVFGLVWAFRPKPKIATETATNTRRPRPAVIWILAFLVICLGCTNVYQARRIKRLSGALRNIKAIALPDFIPEHPVGKLRPYQPTAGAIFDMSKAIPIPSTPEQENEQLQTAWRQLNEIRDELAKAR